MVAVLKIFDTTGASRNERPVLELRIASESITVEELIRQRVLAEVAAHNEQPREYFNGLVTPSDAELTVNGSRMKPGRRIDAEAQVAKALQAFQRNGFFILIGDSQVEALDDRIVIGDDTEVSFHKLVPLVGG